MELEYKFEDMGIPLDGGWFFGSDITGKANVAYNSDGDWWVEDISVIIKRKSTSILYTFDVSKPIEQRSYHFVREILHKNRADAIQELVDEALPVVYEPTSHISAGRAL